MAKQSDAFQNAYNCQAAVDAESQIIVAADLHDAPNDYQALPNILKQTEENCSAKAEAVLADSGYHSAANIAEIEASKGCLLILPQIPVFIAFYNVLTQAIELRHAPFYGWLQNLASKDPYYISPILLGIGMFVQQKLTPNPGYG